MHGSVLQVGLDCGLLLIVGMDVAVRLYVYVRVFVLFAFLFMCMRSETKQCLSFFALCTVILILCSLV